MSGTVRHSTAFRMAEDLFREGMAALQLRRPKEALWAFQSSLKLQRSSGALPNWRCLSYFGLSLAQAEGAGLEAIRACEAALKGDRTDPVLHLNLGRVYLLAGRTPKAILAFQAGLEQDPSRSDLQAALAAVERRSAPVLPMLGRSHPLNVYLGRMRARRKAARAKAPAQPPPPPA